MGCGTTRQRPDQADGEPVRAQSVRVGQAVDVSAAPAPTASYRNNSRSAGTDTPPPKRRAPGSPPHPARRPRRTSPARHRLAVASALSAISGVPSLRGLDLPRRPGSPPTSGRRGTDRRQDVLGGAVLADEACYPRPGTSVDVVFDFRNREGNDLGGGELYPAERRARLQQVRIQKHDVHVAQAQREVAGSLDPGQFHAASGGQSRSQPLAIEPDVADDKDARDPVGASLGAVEWIDAKPRVSAKKSLRLKPPVRRSSSNGLLKL